jgi:hypothetical protein
LACGWGRSAGDGTQSQAGGVTAAGGRALLVLPLGIHPDLVLRYDARGSWGRYTNSDLPDDALVTTTKLVHHSLGVGGFF